MLLRYLLFFVLIGAFLRFLDSMVKLGQRGSQADPVPEQDSESGGRRNERDISDAEYELLPEEPASPDS